MHVPRADLESLLSTLTPRERQIVAYVAAGRPNKVIAIDLDISLRTAEAHRARIFDKLGVRNAMQLACRLCAYGQLGVSPVLGAPLPCGPDAAAPAVSLPRPVPPALDTPTPAPDARYALRAERVDVILADCCAALVRNGYWGK